MVEVLVALGVIFATLLLLAFSMFSSFATIGFSRQRTQASALANQTLEQIRALPFDMLYMSQPDVASGADSQIKPCTSPAGSYCFPGSTGRVIPTATFGSGSSTTAFFPAHVLAPQVGSPGITNYVVKNYVTIDPADSTGQTKVVTIQVSWSPAQVGGAQSNLQVESKIYTSPFSEKSPGAVTTTTAPAVHGYVANAQSQPGTITITGTVLNLNAANVTFNLPTATSYLSGSTSSGTSTGPAGHLVTGGTASSGVSAANLSVVNTPNALATATSPFGSPTNGPNSDSKTPTLFQTIPGSVNQCTVLLVCTLIGGTIDGGIAVGQVNTASALAASDAKGTPNIPSGVIPNNDLGYGRATATQSGALSSHLAINVASVPLLNLGLVNLVPSGNTNPDIATAVQNGATGVPLAQTFNASATKSFSRLDILTGLPVVPGGTLMTLTGFSSTASACAGPGSCTAATAAEAGSLTIAGITNPINLSSPTPITVPNINVSTGILNIAVTTSVTVGSATTTGTSTASITSPLSVNVHLLISTLLGTVADLNIVVNLGSVATSASYS